MHRNLCKLLLPLAHCLLCPQLLLAGCLLGPLLLLEGSLLGLLLLPLCQQLAGAPAGTGEEE